MDAHLLGADGVVDENGKHLLVDRADPSAAAVADIDNADGGEGADRLADDAATDTELLGEGPFARQGIPGLQLARADMLIDSAGHLLGLALRVPVCGAGEGFEG